MRHEIEVTTLPRCVEIERRRQNLIANRQGEETAFESTRRAELRDPVTGEILYFNGVPTSPTDNHGLRFDILASYEPSPGTVAFLGYGSISASADAWSFDTLERQSDGFFVKLAYLFRR